MRRIVLLLPSLLLPLLGCSTVETAFDSEKVACPVGRVVSDAAQVTRFRTGGGTTANDVTLIAQVSPPKVDCNYDKDEGTAELTVVFPISLRQGPVKTKGDDEFTYFVAVVDGANNAILSRKDYRIPLALDGQPSAVFSEEVDNVTFTVAKGKVPADYHVLVGLQLTPAELSYNRATRSPIP